jgi:hypothetical protein
MTAEEAMSPKSAESPKLKKISDDDCVVKKKKPTSDADAEKRGRTRSYSVGGGTPKTPASVGSISRRKKLDLGEDGTETLKRSLKKIGNDAPVSRTPTTMKQKKSHVIAHGQEYSTDKKARSSSVDSITRRILKKIDDNGSVSKTPASFRKKNTSVTADGEEASTKKKDQRTKRKKSFKKSSSEDPDKPVKKKKLRSTSSLERKEKVPMESDDSVYSDDGEGDMDSSGHFDRIWDDGSTHDFRQSSAAASSSPSPTPRQQPKVTPPSHQARVSEVTGAFSTVSKEAEEKDASTLGRRGSQLEGENTTLQVKVQKQEDLIFTLQKEREKELSKFSKTLSELLVLKATHIDTENESGALRKMSGNLESTLVTKNKRISALESASIHQTDQIRQLEREVGFAKQDVIRLKSGHHQRVKDPTDKETAKTQQDLRMELAQVQAILAKRDGKIGALEKARVDQMNQMDDLKKELDYANHNLFEESEKRLIAVGEAERRLMIAAEEAPQNQKRSSGALSEKARQLDEWEMDFIERATQFDKERKAQEEKFAHMLELVDYEKELEDGAKKLHLEEASLDECARALAAKRKCLIDKEKVLDKKQIKLGVLENKLNGEKEAVRRKNMQVTLFLASQKEVALKKQNERGLGSDDDANATIAQLRDEIEKLKEENHRVKKGGSNSKDMIAKQQHEEALEKLQVAKNEEMRHHLEEKHALETQLEEEQVLAEERLLEKDASIEFIQREMEKVEEELEELLREEAERGQQQQQTQIGALMEENELLHFQMEEEREESDEQFNEMTEALERLQESNRELSEKIEAEAVKNKDMIIMDLQYEINELNMTLEKQNTNAYAAKLLGAVKELKTKVKNLKTEFQDKETGAYRNIQARDEAIQMLQKEVDRVHVELGNPVGTFALDLPAPVAPPSRVLESSGFFGKLMRS